ncbi:hypothetical protein H1R20_g7156, partial [Candolleomyces eurysporus]
MRPLCDVYAGTLMYRGREEKVIVKALRIINCTGLPQDKVGLVASTTRKVVREGFISSLLNHANICPFIGLTRVNNFELPAIVSLFVPNQCLEYMKAHPERRLSANREVAAGLKYLHDAMIIHGDVKPDNIMINAQGRVQIIDFGLSKLESMTGFTTQQQGQRNPRYCAPELLRIEGPIKPTFEADVFSLSMTMLQILDGEGIDSMPYNHIKPNHDFKLWSLLAGPKNEQRLIERPRLDRYINVPSACHGLLQRCWEELPADRPPMTVIVNEFRELEESLGELPPPLMSGVNPELDFRPNP